MPDDGSYLFPEHAHEHPEDNDFVDRESSPEDFLDPVAVDPDEEDDA
jgi:hypothetical protein